MSEQSVPDVYRPPWVEERASWYRAVTLADRQPATSHNGTAQGRVHDYFGMTPHSAAARVQRIQAVSAMIKQTAAAAAPSADPGDLQKARPTTPPVEPSGPVRTVDYDDGPQPGEKSADQLAREAKTRAEQQKRNQKPGATTPAQPPTSPTPGAAATPAPPAAPSPPHTESQPPAPETTVGEQTSPAVVNEPSSAPIAVPPSGIGSLAENPVLAQMYGLNLPATSPPPPEGSLSWMLESGQAPPAEPSQAPTQTSVTANGEIIIPPPALTKVDPNKPPSDPPYYHNGPGLLSSPPPAPRFSFYDPATGESGQLPLPSTVPQPGVVQTPGGTLGVDNFDGTSWSSQPVNPESPNATRTRQLTFRDADGEDHPFTATYDEHGNLATLTGASGAYLTFGMGEEGLVVTGSGFLDPGTASASVEEFEQLFMFIAPPLRGIRPVLQGGRTLNNLLKEETPPPAGAPITPGRPGPHVPPSRRPPVFRPPYPDRPEIDYPSDDSGFPETAPPTELTPPDLFPTYPKPPGIDYPAPPDVDGDEEPELDRTPEAPPLLPSHPLTPDGVPSIDIDLPGPPRPGPWIPFIPGPLAPNQEAPGTPVDPRTEPLFDPFEFGPAPFPSDGGTPLRPASPLTNPRPWTLPRAQTGPDEPTSGKDSVIESDLEIGLSPETATTPTAASDPSETFLGSPGGGESSAGASDMASSIEELVAEYVASGITQEMSEWLAAALQELPDRLPEDKKKALVSLYEQSARAGIEIRHGQEAEEYLDWAARRNDASPETFLAVVLGDLIMVRESVRFDVRTLAEEVIQARHQSEGQTDIFQSEVDARRELIDQAERYALTAEEVADIEEELRIMIERGYY
ncbi:hypothetical protein ACTD5D_20905 [Nocardia takedensis]|uniref:hypothetical protein n=1 Tax=Nocardia takedensis TaxID=259390 RepID=UPI003F76498A